MVWATGDPACYAISDAAGEFSLLLAGSSERRSLDAAARYHLDLTAPVPEGSEATLLRLRPAPGSVKGRAEATWGAPLAGALVFVRNPLRVARADAAGEFELERLPFAGEALVVAAADGFETGSARFAVAAARAGPVANVLRLESVFFVSGEVRDAAERPVAGARVWIASLPHSGISSTSDAAGRFVLPLPRKGTFPLRVELGTLASEFEVTVAPQSPRADIGGVLLAHEIEVRGVVRSAKGQAIEGAEVFNVGTGFVRREVTGKPTSGLVATTDPYGLFDLELKLDARRTIHLEFWHEGYAPSMREFAVGESDDSMAVEMGEAYRVAGRVVDAAGRPVAGATVAVKGAQQDFTRHGSRPHHRTDADGRFEIGQVASDFFRLAVMAPGYGVEVLEVRAEGREREIRLEVALRPEARLLARLVDGRGGPIEGAVVTAVESLDLLMVGAAETSDEQGRAELFSLKPGLTRLGIQRPGHDTVYQDVVLLPGTQELELVVN